MTTNMKETASDKDVDIIPIEKNKYTVPQQLLEVKDLLYSINRRLEDCALEWQADISRKQWKIFNSKTIGENPLDQSVLLRTYFTDKNLDETFQHLFFCSKIFSEYFKSFIALLQGGECVLSIKETCDAQNQCSESLKRNLLNHSDDDPLYLPTMIDQRSSQKGKTINLIDNMLLIKNSFVDVIKAKVDFDSKFLGFEAVLHKSTFPPSTNATCHCPNCSKITKTTNEEQKKLRTLSISQNGKTIRRKRLPRSKNTLSNRRGKRSSILANDMGDYPIIASSNHHNSTAQI